MTAGMHGRLKGSIRCLFSKQVLGDVDGFIEFLGKASTADLERSLVDGEGRMRKFNLGMKGLSPHAFDEFEGTLPDAVRCASEKIEKKKKLLTEKLNVLACRQLRPPPGVPFFNDAELKAINGELYEIRKNAGLIKQWFDSVKKR
ncbi:hypothetical protein [Paraburkholderia sp. CI3]|uniref:hypothetical protein n=1 Tax=Paraburkholderia sp. CI3 TaxID=2991060 RepID=UPI003D1CF712